MKILQQICYKGFIIVGLFITKVFHYQSFSLPPQMRTMLPFPYSYFWQSWSYTSAWIYGSSNTSALIFSNDKVGRTETVRNIHHQYLMPYFIRPSLICRGGNMIISWLIIGSLIIFGMLSSRVSCKSHSFWFQC